MFKKKVTWNWQREGRAFESKTHPRTRNGW